MKIKELLRSLPCQVLTGKLDREVEDLTLDSRTVTTGSCFVAVAGHCADGRRFLSQAVAQGAAAVLLEGEPVDLISEDVTVVRVLNLKRWLGLLAKRFYLDGWPRAVLVGITGTKGKTSVAAMVASILRSNGNRPGVIGTLGAQYPGEQEARPLRNTTPDVCTLCRHIRDMERAGCDYILMEISSQAMKERRCEPLQLDYGIFTNLYPDHIGPLEHRDFAEYQACKAALFVQCRYGVMNGDDEHVGELMRAGNCRYFTYGTEEGVDFQGTFIGNSESLEVSGGLEETFPFPWTARFEAYNALAAVSCAHLLGVAPEQIRQGLARVSIPGRMELYHREGKADVIIDYAHNPQSMEQVLQAVRPRYSGKLFVVFGCGGNRSHSRRAGMGKAAGIYGDLSIVTEDNSRREDFFQIAREILTGFWECRAPYLVIPSREHAIRTALSMAKEEDVVLLLGKGHERYLETGGKRKYFNERDVVASVDEEKRHK